MVGLVAVVVAKTKTTGLASMNAKCMHQPDCCSFRQDLYAVTVINWFSKREKQTPEQNISRDSGDIVLVKLLQAELQNT